MDDARFDRLAAALATASTRRGLIFPFITGVLVVPGRVHQDVAARKKRKKCKGNRKKCGKRCIPITNCCTSRQCPLNDVCRNGRCANCVSSDDCPSPSSCQQGACEDGRCVFANLDGGTTICGVGACERSVIRCIDGVEQPCIPGQPSAETCNGLDDDCDGLVDEDFDVDTDPDHCGACNHACRTDPPASCRENGVCAGGVCQTYGSATICQPASCVSTTRQPAATCDGNGGCVAPRPVSCAPFVCHGNGMDCIGSCGGDGDCIPGHFCGGGVCREKLGSGEACQLHSQCASNFCFNGTCQPKRADGDSCSDPFQCASGNCVANVCCATQCGPGQSCVGGTCQG